MGNRQPSVKLKPYSPSGANPIAASRRVFCPFTVHEFIDYGRRHSVAPLRLTSHEPDNCALVIKGDCNEVIAEPAENCPAAGGITCEIKHIAFNICMIPEEKDWNTPTVTAYKSIALHYEASHYLTE